MAHLDDTLTQSDNMRFIRSAMAAPLLDRDVEYYLAQSWRERGDEKALHKLLKSYARLVVAMATRFRGYGLPLADLIQEGHIGLLQAANRFEVGRDVRFSTYATWWIRASMQDYILRNWSIVRTGTTATQKSLFFNLRRLRARIEGRAHVDGLEDGQMLSYKTKTEIAEALKVSVDDVDFMNQRLSGGDQSLNATISDEGETAFQDFLVDTAPTPEEHVMEAHDGDLAQSQLHAAISKLDTREQRIIRARHLAEEPATLDDLGHILHISKERVRQLEARALQKLKGFLGKNEGSAFLAA